MKAKRFMLIGLDGAMPNMLEKFRDEGSIPNMTKLMKQGAFMEALPCIPVDTPTNWVTIATGARPGTHGGYLPTANLGPCTNKAFFILAGPGVKRGYRKNRPICLTDATPTVSHLLNIPTPAQSEGSIIWDILTE